MEGSYIRLSNLSPNQSRQNTDENFLLNKANATKATKKACCGRFNLGFFSRTCGRCFATATLIALVAATLYHYSMKGNFPQHKKRIFNVIITAEILCLGLNFFGSFKDLAKTLRWRILKKCGHYPRMHRARILAFESLINVAFLGWESRSIPWLCIFCIFWILLNLAAQTSVAIISFTFSVNDGKDWKGTYTQNGIINAANLSCYFNPHTLLCPSQDDAVQGLANAYGMSPPIFKRGTYDQIQDVVKSTDNYGYFCRNTPGECTYRFVEYNPDDQQRIYPSFSNRTITASTGQCFTYWESESPKQAKDTTGIPDAYEYKITNGSVHDSIIIPGQLGGIDSTTYIYRGIDRPENTTLFSCGDRCIWMWAHKSEGLGENSTFYQCPITISRVSNTNHDTQIVPDGIARLAASSIALQGRWAVNGSSSKQIWTQFRFYPFEDDAELHSQNDSKAGDNMVEFAIRSLSTMAFRNPSVQVPGLVPCLGSNLEVKWHFFDGLCGAIVFAQIMISACVCYCYVKPCESDSQG